MKILNLHKMSISKSLLITPTLFLVMSLLGCGLSLSDKNKPTTPVIDPKTEPITVPSPHEEAEGGIGAGGGGTLPANPIAKYKVVEILGNAKRFLRVYLNHERYWFHSEIIDNKKYYFGEKNLSTQLESTDIEILEDKPCFDKFGNAVDASIHASRPNTICMSAHQIAPKLIEENANKEIIALLVHELAHFLGANEKEARDLQKWVAIGIRDVSYQDAEQMESDFWNFSTSLESRFRGKEEIEEAIAKADVAVVAKELQKLSDALSSYVDQFKTLPWKMYDYTIRDFEEIVSTKIRLALYYLNSIGADKNKSEQDWFKEQYESCFKEKSKVSVAELSENCALYFKVNLYQSYIFNKLTAISDLKNELKDIFQFTSDLKSRVRAIAFEQPLPFFHVPGYQKLNEWEKFIGKYSATLISCISSKDDVSNFYKNLTTFEVERLRDEDQNHTQTRVSLTEKRPNSTSTDHVYNGAYVAGTVKVLGDEHSALMTAEAGTRWYDRQGHGWRLATRSLTTNDQGELKLTLSSKRFLYDWRGVSEGFSECQYLLHKEN